ncbi:gamma carbonic anhydrase family protein [Lichenihabitans sp. Uapishka_5]|uniref:gamma carbonic anhydrase family protein n=1 Tax=Lichenihabitans sp. Uapishka_5 TaxID=3037302 RepID=UPI0029E7ED37|nr:gamma carbonic anhydrase family protein [Lichenihabitans sp. Uapishka_5]MDX7951497.1 gamma carbonic anhydrase family protein [Lichenihabitans sp. Uapishka_5]
MPVYRLGTTEPELPATGSFWIAPDAHVIGAVSLAPGVGVWFGAVLRGDNEAIAIGPDTNLQEHVLCHTDLGFPLTVGRGCTVGHRAILHGCTIGDDVLIGMGATVMNGARIGAGSIVGAGALLTEAKSFPDHSLIVGAPAKLVRRLDDAAIEGLRRSAAHYVAAWRRFADDLRRLD